MSHRFFHPDQTLEPLGNGWVMETEDGVLGAVLPLDGGFFAAYRKDGDRAVPLPGRAPSRARAAVLLWNATHTVRWGDRS